MKKLFLMLTLTALLCACVQTPTKRDNNEVSQLAVTSVWDFSRNYPKGAKFSIYPTYVKESSIAGEQQDAIYSFYGRAIKEELIKNGYQFVNEGADFMVNYGIALTQDLSDENINYKFGISPGLPEQDGLQKGSFLIAVEAGDSKVRVWRGAVQGFVQEDFSVKQREERIQKIVHMVLSQFYQ